MLERGVEKTLTRAAKSRRVWALKSEILARGFPDRILLAPGGRVSFVELKRPGQKLRPAQAVVAKWLRKLGFLVVKLETPEEVKAFFREWLD